MFDPGNAQQVGAVIAGFAWWTVIATVLLIRVYTKIWRQWWRERRSKTTVASKQFP